MDAPPIPRLVDLVHVFKGVVVEQFKKRVEKLLSDSIPLWRLLKLLFKILQNRLIILFFIFAFLVVFSAWSLIKPCQRVFLTDFSGAKRRTLTFPSFSITFSAHNKAAFLLSPFSA